MTSPASLKPRVPFVVVVALAWATVVDIPTGISLGITSLSGVLTVAVAAVLLLMVPGLFIARTRGEPTSAKSPAKQPHLRGRLSHPTLPVAMKLFAIWAVIMLVWRPSIEGLQNSAVYVMFIAAIPIVAAGSSSGTADWILSAFRGVSLVVGTIAAIQSLAGIEIFGPRSVALVLVVLVAVTVVMPKRSKFDKVLPLLLTAACALTLSRTAFFVAAILIPLSMLFTAGRDRLVKLLAAAIPAYYVMYLLITSWAPLRDRFLEGDAAYKVGGVAVNTSGRAVLWEMTIDSWHEALWAGQGPGAATAMISRQFRNISHPHNEYLRMLHDFGLIGFLFFTVGLAMLIVATWRRARLLGDPIHKAATLALIGIAAVSFTDNVVVYPFVMLPVSVLVGASMSYPLVPFPNPTSQLRSAGKQVA
ncbi:O-antigen ligase family protein [Rhodococcus sp. Rp3]|uniref:O-antigen ligase family protein n=1 Tax=Rhodococcus sp. Rp3 TaxID=2807635 RepID=UPI00233E9917|nr:O-antigen ligase family protein [Rhodococcus sp. Rp3]MDC3727401.1 O-antigen ligase family protein [Rhodococcus sp. Rp3]